MNFFINEADAYMGCISDPVTIGCRFLMEFRSAKDTDR